MRTNVCILLILCFLFTSVTNAFANELVFAIEPKHKKEVEFL